MLHDVRWKQRYESFSRALALLEEALASGLAPLNDLELEGTVQRFEYSFELAWKTIKDFLEFEGVQLDIVTPRGVLKEGFATQMLEDGQVWIDMLDHRNLLSHTYDATNFQEAVRAIHERYLPAFQRLRGFLEDRIE